MKVILLSDVKKVGKKDQVIEVSDGYANNYLIKNKLAILFTKGSEERLYNDLETKQKEEKKLLIEMEKIKSILESEILIFHVQVGKNDQIFGQISTKQIKDKLLEMGYEIKKNNIKIINPIDSLGFHNIKIELHKKVEAKVRISVEKR